MAASWVYNPIYDCRRVAYEGIKHPRAGFGFGAIYGVALNARVEFVLKHFIPPLSTLLPIEKNGIVWFLQSRFAKSLLWHIVFRVTRPHGARIHTSPNLPQVVADLEPDAFKGASNPPLETLAFVGSFCFHALLRFLKRAIKAHRGLTSMEDYPTPREIHDQIIVTIIMLLQQHDDPGLPSLQAQMLQFCDLRTIDVLQIPSLSQLFVLFGLVDSHDLAGLLEVALEEVETQIPLHQEEENCSVFLQRGGRCFMEHRMYRAQIEVSLFSKAIANLCEELNTRNQPVSWHVGPNLTLLAVNPVGPWRRLLMTNVMPGFSCHLNLKTLRKLLLMPAPPPNSPRLQESLLRRGDILSSLPRSMKSWVDNATYSMYISACFAETNEPLRIDNKERFTRKEYKSPDTLMSIFHILDLKTQRAQAEADMFSEAIERTAEIELTDDGLSSGSGTTTTCDSRSPHDWFDDWFSSSSAPSNASDSDML
ncbi:hypothetical protein DEU56DRAFT_985301 [Suillus clintonianus]|uniref:uncharacterized protein n=1 Tax=Suillus clintonianus TaxID=1904413 RepID=UPI001B85DDA3|nr:uncharacterized protein DEU56DRAFT_985301 [Suillus clintonianus]KAG2111843.1 hypothetical protein DEU56DRAFT_985301 [Suillus clintonianus]